MPTPWKVPPTWTGQTVVVLAGGPSLLPSLPAVERAVAAGRARALAVNNAFQIAPWADWLHASDYAWWRHHAQSALLFPGVKTAAQAVPFRAVNYLFHVPKTTWTPDADKIAGPNSAHHAAVIAIHAGAARVVLCGVDCRTDAGSHWHGDHPLPLRNSAATTFQNAVKAWAAFAGEAPVEIINCSPGSAVTCFPSMPIEDALC